MPSINEDLKAMAKKRSKNLNQNCIDYNHFKSFKNSKKKKT